MRRCTRWSGYSPAEAERALGGDPARLRHGEGVAFGGSGVAALGEPLSPAERYGRLFADASRKAGQGRDMVWLGVIDWHFRIQRPQHLATQLADAGARIFYVSIVFEQADQRGRFRIIETPHPGVYEVRMRLTVEPAESIYRGLSDPAVAELQLALDELIAMLGIFTPIVVVQHPAWHQVACGVPGATVVYDCLDLATGFSNVAKSLGQAETALLASADVVVAASRPLGGARVAAAAGDADPQRRRCRVLCPGVYRAARRRAPGHRLFRRDRGMVQHRVDRALRRRAAALGVPADRTHTTAATSRGRRSCRT